MLYDMWRIGTTWGGNSVYDLFKKHSVAFVGFGDLNEGPEEGAWGRLRDACKNNTLVLLAVAKGHEICAAAKVIRCYDTLSAFMEDRGVGKPDDLLGYDDNSTRACAVELHELPTKVRHNDRRRLCHIQDEAVHAQVYEQYMKIMEGG